MIKTVLVLLAVACVAVMAVHTNRRGPKAHELTASYTFEKYVHDFGKKYSDSVEYARRARIFAAALTEVLEHNSKPSTYKKGINHLSDWDEVELRRIRGGRHEATYKTKYASAYEAKVAKPPAAAIDWRNHVPQVVTAVKDQGQCGDCWAHAVTESIESSYAIATGQLFVLSQQQVTSCTPQAGSCYSCEGSFPTLGFEYAVENGLTEEWIYPFESYSNTNPACNANPYIQTPINTIVNISGYTLIGTNQQADMVAALNELGPLSILVDASSWSSYESGIFSGCSYANNISLDHAVNVVGYGTESGNDYWIVRNSWAPSWGENGYIRLAKPAVPQCGWNTGAAYSIDCYGNAPPAYWACGECGILFGAAFPTVNPSSSSSGSAATPAPTIAPNPAPPTPSSGAFVVYATGSSYPTPPAGYVQASLSDITGSAFVSYYNAHSLTDLTQELSGCCIFNLTDGFLTYEGKFLFPYTNGGVRQCASQLTNPVYFGAGWYTDIPLPTIQPSDIAKLGVNTTQFCAEPQPNTFGIFKQAS